jgi:hypothetical protein
MKLLRSAPLALLVLGALVAAAHAEKPQTPACVTWRGLTVTTAVGYDHVVEIENGCAKPAACTVSTDVAPEPLETTVPVKERVELVTFRGSPSYVFQPKVECSLR